MTKTDRNDDALFESEVVNLAEELLFKHLLAGSRGALQEDLSGSQLIGKEQEAMREADLIVQKPSIRDRLCPALTSVSGDLLEVAKIVTAGLLPLAVSGVIPKQSLLFAAITVVIVRAGISAICKDATK